MEAANVLMTPAEAGQFYQAGGDRFHTLSTGPIMVDYKAMFNDAYNALIREKEAIIFHLILIGARVPLPDAVRVLQGGYVAPEQLQGLLELPPEDVKSFYTDMILGHVNDADGSDLAPLAVPLRKTCLLAACQSAKKYVSETKHKKESRESMLDAIHDPVAAEVSFSDLGALLVKWRNSHQGIDLAPSMTPSRFLFATIKKMLRQDIWDAVSLDLCHPKSNYHKQQGGSIFEGVKLTISDKGGIQPTLTKEPEKKKVREVDFWQCLEVLKVAYHLMEVVDENIFDLHIRDLRARLVQYPQALPNIMSADALIRQNWHDVMQREGKSLPEVIKLYSSPFSQLGTAFWTELLLHDARTRLPLPGSNQSNAPGEPPQKRSRGNKAPGQAGGPRAGAGGEGGKGAQRGNARAVSTDPFVFQKDGQKVCQFHAWKNDCRKGADCTFSHACPHKGCATTVKHSAAQAHAADWTRVFGERNPIALMKGSGKGKGGAGKGGAGKGGRR